MSDVTRLEEDRAKCLLRLGAQSSDKCRHRTFYELASVCVRLGRSDEALEALRDAVACGLDVSYAADLRDGALWAPMRSVPAFLALLDSLEGVDTPMPLALCYAKGERERCVAEGLSCAHCSHPLEEPLVHIDCGNMFCMACVAPLPVCPQCQATTDGDHLVPLAVRLIRTKLDAIKVHCARCQKVVGRAALEAHVAQCPILCPHGCRQKVSPAALQDHASSCSAVEVACAAADVLCPWRGARRDVASHARKCALVKQHALLRRVAALEEANRKLEARLALCVTKEGTENVTM